MPLLNDVSLGALRGDEPDKKLDSVVRQVNEWGRTLSNETIASVQKGRDGKIRIVSGLQTLNDYEFVGTLYYDSNDVPRIFIGLAPDDLRPGIWISNDGVDVISELVS